MPLFDRPVAEEAHRDLAGSPRWTADSPAPAAMPKPPPTMPLAPSMPECEVGDVHRAAAALVGAGRLAVQLGHQHIGRHPLGDRVAVATMGGGDVVVGSEQGAHRRRSPPGRCTCARSQAACRRGTVARLESRTPGSAPSCGGSSEPRRGRADRATPGHSAASSRNDPTDRGTDLDLDVIIRIGVDEDLQRPRRWRLEHDLGLLGLDRDEVVALGHRVTGRP